MAEKRYTVVFDAKDMASSRLSEIERKTRQANRRMDEFSKEAKKAGSFISQMGTGFNKIWLEGSNSISRLTTGLAGITGILGGIATAAGLAGVALSGMAVKGIVDHMIQPAMTAEMTQMSIEGLSGSPELGKTIYEQTKAKGMESMFADQPFMDTTQVFLNNTKDPEEIARGLNITERLATKNPSVAMGGGMEGAKVAISEVMAGDMTSIAERFNTSRSTLAAAGVSSSHDWLTNLEAVDRLLEEQGFTDEYVKKINESTVGQWEKLKSNTQTTFATIGKGMLEEIRPAMKTVNKLFEDQTGMNRFTSSMSDRFRGALKDIFGFGEGVNLTWKDITNWSTETFDGVSNVLSSTGDAFVTMVTILSGGDLSKPYETFKNFGDLLEGIADKIDKLKQGMIELDEWGDKVGKFTGIGQEGGMQKQIDDGMWYLPEGAKGGRGLIPWMMQGFPSERQKPDGSHANGIDYVPYDGYLATLHEGERVVTRSENTSTINNSNVMQQQGASVMITGNEFIVRNESDIEAIGRQIVREITLAGART